MQAVIDRVPIALTRTKIATNRAKNSIIGSATEKARLRQKARGSPAITMTIGRNSSTPSVSPTHHVTQLVQSCAAAMAPSAAIKPSDSVALVRQRTGAQAKNRSRSLPLSKALG